MAKLDSSEALEEAERFEGSLASTDLSTLRNALRDLDRLRRRTKPMEYPRVSVWLMETAVDIHACRIAAGTGWGYDATRLAIIDEGEHLFQRSARWWAAPKDIWEDVARRANAVQSAGVEPSPVPDPYAEMFPRRVYPRPDASWPDDVTLTITDPETDTCFYQALPDSNLAPTSLPELADSLRAAQRSETIAEHLSLALEIWSLDYGREIVGNALPLSNRYIHSFKIAPSKVPRLIAELEATGWRRHLLDKDFAQSNEL